MKAIRISNNWFDAGWVVTCISLFLFGLVLAMLFVLPALTNFSVPDFLLLVLGGGLSGAIGYGTGKLLIGFDTQVYGRLSRVSPEKAARFYTWIQWAHAIIYLLDGLAITALLREYLSDTVSSPSDIMVAIVQTLLADAPESIGNLLRVAVLAILCYNCAQSWLSERFGDKNMDQKGF